MLCGAPTPYKFNLLFDFQDHYRREPDEDTTLAEWWALLSPPHHRLDALVTVATVCPEHEVAIREALQRAAAVAGCVVPDATPITHWHLFADRALDPRRQPANAVDAADAILTKLVVDLEVMT